MSLTRAKAKKAATAWRVPQVRKALGPTNRREARRVADRAAKVFEAFGVDKKEIRKVADRAPSIIGGRVRLWVPTLRSDIQDEIDRYFDSTDKPTKTGVRRALDRAILTWKRRRLPGIVETEITNASNEIFQGLAAKVSRRKIWITRRDERVRPSHRKLEGQIRPMNKPFRIPGTNRRAQRPGAFGIREEDINCRCVMTPYPPRQELTALWTKLDRLVRSWEIAFRKRILEAVRSQRTEAMSRIRAIDDLEDGDDFLTDFHERDTSLAR